MLVLTSYSIGHRAFTVPLTMEYIDDSHARFKSNEEVEKFFEILINQHQKIRYTMECQDYEKTINFLDVSVMFMS